MVGEKTIYLGGPSLMRAAIITNGKLPDPRIERQIHTLLKEGIEVHYIGAFKGTTGVVDIEKVHVHAIEGWSHYVNLKRQPYYWWMKRRVHRILKQIRPDSILASNIFAGILVHELGYPVVIDDREQYSLKRYIGLRYIRSRFRRFLQQIYIKKIRDYEEILAENHPFITVTKKGYVYYKYDLGCKKVYVVRNFPLRKEVPGIKMPHFDEVVFNYIGKEVSLALSKRTTELYRYFNYHRDISATIRVLHELYKKYSNVKLEVIGDPSLRSTGFMKCRGYVKHMKLYDYIMHSHYGLYSYKPSVYQQYVSSFRVYMYALAGVPPIVTSSYSDIIAVLKHHAIVIDEHNYLEDLVQKLEQIIIDFDRDKYIDEREKIHRYASQNTVWENNENVLLEALKSCY